MIAQIIEMSQRMRANTTITVCEKLLDIFDP